MHVTDKSPSQVRWYLKPFFWMQRRHYGAPLVPALVWARVPALYFALTGFNAALNRRRSPLEPVLRALVQTRVSQVNQCAFCMDLNAAVAAERDGSMAKALVVGEWRSSDLFSARERLALEYAEVITQTGQRVDADLIARLGEHFDENALIEVTALIAFQNLSSKFNAALDIPSQGLCRAP